MSYEFLRPGQASVYEPFAGSKGLTWLHQRVNEGYFGPTATYDRSRLMQRSFELTSLPGILDKRKEFAGLLGDPQEQRYHKRRDQKLKELREEWQQIPKGGAEELKWAEEVVALTAAGFEDFRHRRGDTAFELRDNQLYDMTVLLLNKGSYEFGNLETESRGTEMHTGEGKTFCHGLLAPMLAHQSDEEKVIVIEPNYISAKNHAEQMAPFYDEFYGMGTGVATGVAERMGYAQKTVFNSKGVLENVTVATGGFKSYRFAGGVLREDPGAPGRKNAWGEKIIYVDPDALAFDWLADNQIGKTTKTGLPDLEKVTFLPAEADQLLLDMARNAYIVSEKLPPGEVWGAIGDASGLSVLYPPEWSEADRQAVTQRAMFSIWGNLFEARRRGDFKEGYGQDYMVINKQLVPSERMNTKALNMTAQALAPVFGYQPEKEEARIDAVVGSWAGTDLQKKGDLDNAVAAVRKAYYFKEAKSEKALRALLAQNPPPDQLAGQIKDMLRQDHNLAVWERVSSVMKHGGAIPERSARDLRAEESRVDEVLGNYIGKGTLGITSADDLIAALRQAYYFREPQNEIRLRALFEADTPPNLLAGKVKELLREDHAQAALDGAGFNGSPPNETLFTREFAHLDQENIQALADLSSWLTNNAGVVNAALEQLFGMKSQIDFLGGNKPVLLDEYGFPLERRQLQDISQTFLQMHNFWEQENLGAGELTPQVLANMEGKYAARMEMSRTVSRITIPSLMNRARRMRFSSGSLIPASGSLVRIYGAEVVGVGRHLPLPDRISPGRDDILDAGAQTGGTFNYDVAGEKSQIHAVLQQWMGHPFRFSEMSEPEAWSSAVAALRSAYPLSDARTEERIRDLFAQGVAPGAIEKPLERVLWEDHMHRVWQQVREYAREKTVPKPGQMAKRLPFLSPQSTKAIEDMARWAVAHPDMADIAYEAVFGRSFREDFKEPSLVTRCLDGGLARVKFMGSYNREFFEFQKKALEISAAGNMGLFIVPDIEVARRLQNSMRARGVDAVLATGAQELSRRGTLDRAASAGAPGRVIITTWIAHRDIDVHMPPEVRQNGGLDTVVAGVAPSERGLWQALARSVRGDLPGTRTLLLTPDDFADIRNRDVAAGQLGLVHRPPRKVHEERERDIRGKWEEALSGNRKAMEDLFGMHLSSLRTREGQMEQQLIRTLIRDADLEKWQEMFVDARGRLNEDMQQYMEDLEKEVIAKAAKEFRVSELPSDIRKIPTGKVSGELDAVLRRLESKMGYLAPKARATESISESARDQALQIAWGEFLRFLDVEVAVFLTRQEIQKLPVDLQRQSFASHVEDILSGRNVPQGVQV